MIVVSFLAQGCTNNSANRLSIRNKSANRLAKRLSVRLSIESKVNPLYIKTEKGFTVIDTKTDKVVTKGFKPHYSGDIVAFYKTNLFTYKFAYNKNEDPGQTTIWNLETGKSRTITGSLTDIKKEGRFLYGLESTVAPEFLKLIFIYDIYKKKFVKIKSNEFMYDSSKRKFIKNKEYYKSYYSKLKIPKAKKKAFIKTLTSDKVKPIFVGFITFNDGRKAIALRNNAVIEIRTLESRKLFQKRAFNSWAKEKTTASAGHEVLFLGTDFTKRLDMKILDLEKNAVRKFQFPAFSSLGKDEDFEDLGEDTNVFSAYGRLYIGKSTGVDEEQKIPPYKVYRLTDGKLIKEIEIDVNEFNTLRLDDLLVFITGPHVGHALNLRTAEIEKIDITEQSVFQDGKIYSALEDRLIIRRDKRIMKTIKLDSKIRTEWRGKREDEVSPYNRAIFSSQPLDSNFWMMDGV